MDEDTKKRIIDYFDPWDLVEYCQPYISTADIVEAFEDAVEEALPDLEEFWLLKESNE